jgi:hypothetical protein
MKLPFLAIFAIVSMLLSASLGHARGGVCEQLFNVSAVGSDPLPEVANLQNGPGFVSPNERNTAQLRAIFASLNTDVSDLQGIFLSVGTERAFMSAALAGERARTLVIVDLDPRAALYNRINKALLAVARDRDDYLHLRLKADFTELQTRLQKAEAGFSVENEIVLSDADAWAWWKKTVQTAEGWGDFHKPHPTAFKDANYLFDTALFNSISKLAKENRIIVLSANLTSPAVFARISEISQAVQQKIAFLDLSNAWQIGYMGHLQTINLVDSFRRLSAAHAQLILTYQSFDETTERKTIFKYTNLEFAAAAPNNQDLAALLGNLERLEPSRRSFPQDRVRARGGRDIY